MWGRVALIRECLQKVSQADPGLFLNYPTRDAYKPMRQAVVDWLSDLPLGALTHDDIVLTHGGQNGLCLVFQTILRGPKPVVLVEDLSYAGFRRAGEVDAIGSRRCEDGQMGRRPQSNGTCVAPDAGTGCMRLAPRCKTRPGAILRWSAAKKSSRSPAALTCRSSRMIAIGWVMRASPAIARWRLKRGWHVSSISKVLTPSLRVGFAIAPRERSVDLRRSAEYGYFGLAQPLAELTRLLLSDPRTRQVARDVRAKMGEYVRVAVNALGGFDLNWAPDVPFVWLNLPSGWRAAAFSRAAEREGIQLRSADEFALRDGRAPNAIRIAMNGHVSLERFEDAMQRLRKLLDNPA